MLRAACVALLLAVLWAPPAGASLRIDNRLSFTRPDGSTVPFAHNVRVACGPWEAEEVPTRTLHVRVGVARGPFWMLRAVIADVRRRPVVRFPNTFLWNRPRGADLFALDGENELSSGEGDASGRITFERVRCGRRLAVRFRVRATLGSEFIEGDPVTVRGSFRASG